MKYRQIEHTADFGIQVFGADPRELFSNAAHALFDLITDIRALKGERVERITVNGDDWPDLMFNWLRELLFFWNGKERLVKTVKIETLSENSLSAVVCYDPYDSDSHEIHTEIKAVTYHQLQVKSRPSGWEAQVIFDV